jgi:hypothetical protein
MGTNGTPDYYYESYQRIKNHLRSAALWVEYKYVKKLPENILLIDHEKKYALSALQRRWLNRARKNRTPVAVVLGSEEGAIIAVGGRWERPISLSQVKEEGLLNSPRDVAEFIAGVGDYRILIEHVEDARIQYEYPSTGV